MTVRNGFSALVRTGREEEGFSFKHLFLGPTQKTARLPTAATWCAASSPHRTTVATLKGAARPGSFNTLKLPAYERKTTLREKLLYSIRAGAGFELS